MPESLAAFLQQELEEEQEEPLTLTFLQEIATFARMKRKPLSVAEIRATIIEKELYSKTLILREIQSKLDKYCRRNLASTIEYFIVDSDNRRYWLINRSSLTLQSYSGKQSR
ncbi:hypothetical protein ACQ4M3_20850 [Leptolyngbya sp. AN03gr2]|uniref:hypothetical protein n=1 Tax=unclassified Leptolyngbya TaxID=2650499 RepID=UPI003D31AE62